MNKIISIILTLLCTISSSQTNFSENNNTFATDNLVATISDYKNPSYNDQTETPLDYEIVVGSEIDDKIEESLPNSDMAKYEDNKNQCIKDIYAELKSSDNYSDSDSIEIRFLNDAELSNSDNFIMLNTVDEIVNYIEAEEEFVENADDFSNEYDSENNDFVSTVATYKTVSKGYSRGVPGLHFNLSADIKYNTSNHVIQSVNNRKFTITGFTVATHAEDKSYKTTYLNSKKACKIRCDYTDVTQVVTPIGAIEILRKNAYQEFKWSYNKGVYDGNGGYR